MLWHWRFYLILNKIERRNNLSSNGFDTTSLLYNVYNKDVVSNVLEDKLFLLSILFNIKKQNFKYDYFLKSEMKIFIAFNPRLKSEEASLFKLVRKLKSWNYPTEYHPRYNARVKFKKIN